ncbi:GTPaseactivating protein [Pelomyxa schiedti]|nr:GTPaseactivating protein [Pelomyxa schiedti]
MSLTSGGDPRTWSEAQVVTWVKSLGPHFVEHAEKFSGVNGAQLIEMNLPLLINKPFFINFVHAKQLIDHREELVKKNSALKSLDDLFADLPQIEGLDDFDLGEEDVKEAPQGNDLISAPDTPKDPSLTSPPSTGECSVAPPLDVPIPSQLPPSQAPEIIQITPPPGEPQLNPSTPPENQPVTSSGTSTSPRPITSEQTPIPPPNNAEPIPPPSTSETSNTENIPPPHNELFIAPPGDDTESIPPPNDANQGWLSRKTLQTRPTSGFVLGQSKRDDDAKVQKPNEQAVQNRTDSSPTPTRKSSDTPAISVSPAEPTPSNASAPLSLSAHTSANSPTPTTEEHQPADSNLFKEIQGGTGLVSGAMSSSAAAPGTPPAPSSKMKLKGFLLKSSSSDTKAHAKPPSGHPHLPNQMVYNTDELVKYIRVLETSPWDGSVTDYWTSTTEEGETWTGSEPNIEKNGVPPMDLTCRGNGAFIIEFDQNSVTHTQNQDPQGFVDPHRYFLFYKAFFAESPHELYVCMEDNTSPVIIAIQDVDKERDTTKRVLLFNKKTTARYLVHSRDTIKTITSSILKLSGSSKIMKVKSPALVKDLLNFEERSSVKAYKFGIIYVKANQHDENEIFSNLHHDGSPQYKEFLRFIGDKVYLCNWEKYRAGLDAKTGTTGKKSVYIQFRGYEIMFHVSTYLPFQPDDLQRVERKRHIGNDVIVIIFKERADQNDTFSPKLLTSHFNHSFFVVEPLVDQATSKTACYNICVANKAGISPYPPFMPESPRFPLTPESRDWLLLKMINAERTALVQSPEFRGMMTARKGSLENIVKTYLPTKG